MSAEAQLGNLNKRFLRFGRSDPLIRIGKRADPLIRFGRADPLIRFGRSDPLIRIGRGGDPIIRFGKRGFEPLIRIGRSDPIIRFGRSDPLIRFGKRGDPESDADLDDLYENSGYLRFGRSADAEPLLGEDDVNVERKRRDVEETETSEHERTKREISQEDENSEFVRWGRRKKSGENSVPAKKADVDTATGDRGYLRFGRVHNGFGKRYLRFGREGGYLRFGKRSAES